MHAKLFHYLCALALLLAVVLGSTEINAESNPESMMDPSDPEVVKFRFMNAIANGAVSQADELSKSFSFLTASFNRDIFSKFLEHVDPMPEETVSQILAILEPSFADLSHSTTTPLILAIREIKMKVILKLMGMKSVVETFNHTDEFNRTALMYAAKRGLELIIRKILDVSIESIDAKDDLDKTALHYICEMNSIESPSVYKYLTNDLPLTISGVSSTEVKHKLDIASTLIGRGATVYAEGPEYKLFSNDLVLIDRISDMGGKVQVKDIGDRAVRFALGSYLLSRMAHMLHLDLFTLYLLFANPFSVTLNKLCFMVQDLLFPGVDLSFNFSIDTGAAVHDFSLNIVFILILVQIFVQASKEFADFNSKFKIPNIYE